MIKCCLKCKKIKLVSEFHKDKNKKLGAASACKLCACDNRRQYYKQNKEKELKRNKIYVLNNLKKVNQYKRLWEIKNIKKIYKRRMADPHQKIAINLRIRLNAAIKRIQKQGSAVRDLGCSVVELKKHLESQFYVKLDTGEMMSWKNYGFHGWHIDHIKPLITFNLSDRKQFLEACHYTNLQPLWAKENWSKGAKENWSKNNK